MVVGATPCLESVRYLWPFHIAMHVVKNLFKLAVTFTGNRQSNSLVVEKLLNAELAPLDFFLRLHNSNKVTSRLSFQTVLRLRTFAISITLHTRIRLQPPELGRAD